MLVMGHVTTTLFLYAALTGHAGTPLAGPKQVRGWMIHGASPAYHRLVLAKAKEYGVNHLEIAGNNPTTSDEMTGASADLISKTAKAARALGIDPYIWVRELNTRDKSIKLDPSTEAGARFWNARLNALKQAFKRAPDLNGIVLSYASTPTEIWYVTDVSPFWTGKTMEQRIRFVTDQFLSVTKPLNKRVYVRDFNHSPQQLKWLVNAFTDYPQITLHTKWTPQDWQLYYPDSFAIGAIGKTPQVIEADLGAEYWGRSMVPVSLVRYIKARWDYDRAHGCQGIVARIDRNEESALDTPSEINLFALSKYLADPKTTPEEVYRAWNAKRYGLRPNSTASNTLTQIYERTFEQAKQMYYTLGFWTPKDQSMIPDTVRSIEAGIRGKSSALWDPSLKPLEEELAHPTANTHAKIMKDRAAAIRLADQNLADLQKVADDLSPKDAADWQTRLELSLAMAKVWHAMADAVWTLRAAEEARDRSEATRVLVIAKADTFQKESARLRANGPAASLRFEMIDSAQNLATDIRVRAAAIGGQ